MTLQVPTPVIVTVPLLYEQAPFAAKTTGLPEPPPVAVGVYVFPKTAETGAVEVNVIVWLWRAAVTVNVAVLTWFPDEQPPALPVLQTTTVHVPTVLTVKVTSFVTLVVPATSVKEIVLCKDSHVVETPGAYH